MNPWSQYNNASDEIWIRVKTQVAGRERMQERERKKTGVSDKTPVASSEQKISGSQTGGPGRISSGVWGTDFKQYNWLAFTSLGLLGFFNVSERSMAPMLYLFNKTSKNNNSVKCYYNFKM